MKIYVASKFSRARIWKKLFAEWRSQTGLDIEICARWVNEYAGLVPDHPQFCKIGWRHDIEDVKNSHLLMIYATTDEKLRGALVEVGAALAFKKPVIAIGNHPDYGTWQHHELVHVVEDFTAAKELVRLFLLDYSESFQ